jgi:hypothetical protein
MILMSDTYGIDRLCANSFFKFLGTSGLLSIVYILIPMSAKSVGVLFSPHHDQNILSVVFLMIAYLKSVSVYLIVVLV